jgi:hypothetical protein
VTEPQIQPGNFQCLGCGRVVPMHEPEPDPERRIQRSARGLLSCDNCYAKVTDELHGPGGE